jgi:quercetin dioxygenase-like cupin family protein
MEATATKTFIKNDGIEWEAVAEKMKRKIMAYDKSLMMVKVEFETGGIGTVHQHPHVQISHVERGVFEVEIGGEKSILKAGDAFYVPSNVLHGAVCLESGVLIDVFSPMRDDFIKQP